MSRIRLVVVVGALLLGTACADAGGSTGAQRPAPEPSAPQPSEVATPPAAATELTPPVPSLVRLPSALDGRTLVDGHCDDKVTSGIVACDWRPERQSRTQSR